MKKELIELREKMRSCDVTQFKNYEQYTEYCNNLILNFLKKYDDISSDELHLLLEEIRKNEKE